MGFRWKTAFTPRRRWRPPAIDPNNLFNLGKTVFIPNTGLPRQPSAEKSKASEKSTTSQAMSLRKKHT